MGDVEVTRETIIDTALDILSSEGIASLSLHGIARALGIQTPSLYWYFKNKSDIYSQLTEHMLRELLSKIDPLETGRELLWDLGIAMRETLRSRRDAAKLMSIAGVSDVVWDELLPSLLDRIAVSDISRLQARKTILAMQALSLGWVLYETNPARDDFAAADAGGDNTYQQALAALVFDTQHLTG